MEEKNNAESVKETVDSPVQEKTKKEKSEFDDIIRSNKKGGIFKFIGNLIFWLLFIFLVGLAVIAYLNYNKVENDEEASMYFDKNEYVIEEENVTVYSYLVYKVIDHESADGRQVSLKLWFLDDINED